MVPQILLQHLASQVDLLFDALRTIDGIAEWWPRIIEWWP